jgi:signal transduction histidine kinase
MLFHKTHKTFAYFNKQNGLPNNNIFGLATDKQNNIWIATGNGLLRMNARNNKLVSFNEEDGLLNKQFLHEITYLNGGRASIATTTGFVYFSLNTTVAFKSPPDVQITSFKVLDKPLSVDSMLSGNKKIELNHSQNFITIGFSSISFLGRNTIQYFYQLQGVDKNWRTAGKQRFATYSDLNPGHYIFRVKCKNRDDISSKKITELSIYISPPWWSAWWAYLLYILLGGIVVYTAYRDRIKQLKSKQSDQIKAMVITQEEERKRISRDLHDDIGTKLSALKLFISSLQNKATLISNEEIRSLAESSEKFIKEAMQDVRELLLNLSPTVLEEFGYTTAVEGIINKINETKQIHFSLVMFGMAHRLKKDYELALYRITQELINNVLKHAEAKNVSLQIGQRDEKIILMIEDDGKGFDINAHKDGYGLHNLNARTKLMHGIMTIDSQPGKGTSVLIEIPYNFNGT